MSAGPSDFLFLVADYKSPYLLTYFNQSINQVKSIKFIISVAHCRLDFTKKNSRKNTSAMLNVTYLLLMRSCDSVVKALDFPQQTWFLPVKVTHPYESFVVTGRASRWNCFHALENLTLTREYIWDWVLGNEGVTVLRLIAVVTVYDCVHDCVYMTVCVWICVWMCLCTLA